MYKLLSLLLVTGLILSACVTKNVVTPKEEILPTAEATEESTFCADDGQVFMPGDDVVLGTEPDEDYTAFLSTIESGSMRSYQLTITPKDGAEIPLAGGELPEDGKTITVAWGHYLEIEVTDCGLFYHYRVVKLLGASANPVLDAACIPGDYSSQSLKPWPFASHQTVWSEGKEEVFLVSDSDPKIYLAFVRNGTLVEAIPFRRPLKGETTSESIGVGAFEVSVTVKNCDGNYFFKVGYPKAPPSPSYKWVDRQ